MRKPPVFAVENRTPGNVCACGENIRAMERKQENVLKNKNINVRIW